MFLGVRHSDRAQWRQVNFVPLCQEPQLGVINTGVSNHRKAHPCSTWEVSVGWGPSWGSHLEDPHMARPWAVGFVIWWLGSKGKRRERENQAEAILPFMINLMSHKASSHWLGQLQVPLSSRGGNCATPPLDGEACSCHLMNMWSGTYIGGAISRENIICHGGLAGNTGNDKHWVILYNIILSHMVCNRWLSSMWAGVAPKK